jgi:hypothetical protein
LSAASPRARQPPRARRAKVGPNRPGDTAWGPEAQRHFLYPLDAPTPPVVSVTRKQGGMQACFESEQHQATPGFLTYVFLVGRKTSILGVWTAPAAPTHHSRRWGASPLPHLLEWFLRAAGAAQTSRIDDFSVLVCDSVPLFFVSCHLSVCFCLSCCWWFSLLIRLRLICSLGRPLSACRPSLTPSHSAYISLSLSLASNLSPSLTRSICDALVCLSLCFRLAIYACLPLSLLVSSLVSPICVRERE